jgi:3D (Asp-Asp-Asp) domain-containing protein
MGLLLLSSAAAAINPSATASTPSPIAASDTFGVTLTAYNAVPSQTDGDPLITADGGPSDPDVVAARSQDLGTELPFGTIIQITAPAATSTTCGYAAVEPLIGYRVITDVMNAKIKDHVDVLFPTVSPVLLEGNKTVNAANALGSCPGVGIRVVGHIDLTKNPLPATQADLAALVTGSNLALAAK